MKKKSILSLILLLTVLCGFNSCQDKPFDPIDDDPEYLLCNATGWYDEYIDSSGYPCTQHITFYSNGDGKETIVRYFSDFPGDFEELRNSFYWEWDDDYYGSIYMEYPNGDYLFFDQLVISPYELSGLLDGEKVVFEPF